MIYYSKAWRKARRQAFLDWLDDAALSLALMVLALVTLLFLFAPIIY